MGRPATKDEMVEAANMKFAQLWQVIDSMSEESLTAEFDFSNDSNKREAHWKRDKNLRDVLVHLYEWHQLLLNWIRSNLAGNRSNFLPEPYTWKTYGEMNNELWKKHQKTKLADAKTMFKASHRSVMELTERFSSQELFTKMYFDWTGSTTLGSYCVSSLSSHYDWAIKKLRAHAKKFS